MGKDPDSGLRLRDTIGKNLEDRGSLSLESESVVTFC